MSQENPLHSFQFKITLADNAAHIAIQPVADRVVITAHLIKMVDPHSVDTRRDTMALEIAEYALENKPQLLRKNGFPLPQGMVANHFVFSQKGDKFVVLAGGPLRDANGKIETQTDPTTRIPSYRWQQGIWVGDLQRRSFRELGHLTYWAEGTYSSIDHFDSTPYRTATYKDSLLNLRFTHDEKRVSFYQNHILYTLPVEAE